MTNGRKKITALLLPIGFLLAVELTLRLMGAAAPSPPRFPSGARFMEDDRLFWRLKPGYFHEFNYGGGRGSVVQSINTEGFRGPERNRNSERRTIVCMGDSVTYGVKVEWEDSYPAQLQFILDQNGDGLKWEVINAGVPGHTSYQGMMYLPDIMKLKPEIITLAYGLNDYLESSITDEKRGKLNTSSLTKASHYLHRLHFYNLLERLILNIRLKIHGMNPGHVRRRVSPEEYYSNIRTMVEMIRREGIEPILVTQAIKSGFNMRDISYDYYLPNLIKAAEELGVPKADVVRRYKRIELTHPHRAASLFIDDIHVNRQGAHIYAETIYEVLSGSGLLRENRQKMLIDSKDSKSLSGIQDLLNTHKKKCRELLRR